MYVKPILASILITFLIIGTFVFYFVIDKDLQNVVAQQHRLLPDNKSIFDETMVPLKIFEETYKLKKFASDDDVRDFLIKVSSNDSYVQHYLSIFPKPNLPDIYLDRVVSHNEDYYYSDPFMEMSCVQCQQSASLTQRINPNFSITNVQVTGVDEPDHIKTDGKYIYVLKGNVLVVIDAEINKKISTTKLDLDIQQQDSHNMFLNKDRLVIFYTSSNYEKRIIRHYDETAINSLITHAMILDVSDPDFPKFIKDYEIDGDFHDAQMIGNYVYIISTMEADNSNPVIPHITVRGSSVVFDPDVFYFDNFESEYTYNIVTAINIFDENFVNSKIFLMGSTNTIYTSQDGLYITYKKSLSTAHHDAIKKDRFFNVLVPMLPESVKDEINKLQNNSQISTSRKHALATNLLENIYNNMGYFDKRTLFANIEEQLVIYDWKIQEEIQNTSIYKIGISEGGIDYKSHGGIPGLLLNQFSMDEYKDSFRVVTTYEKYDGNGKTTKRNAVYVLDNEHLDIVGTLKDIAPNEDIFSARFVGDRLYLVTFEIVDPFFVIDLSSNTPEILGELKIPGFSNYLHSYDDDHIVGIGRDSDTFGVQSGVKIALFDVSDVKNPFVVDDVVLGKEGKSGSEALSEHKAFFLDSSMGILSVPIYYDNTALTSNSHDTVNTWNGFYVYNLDPQKGFDLKGTIEHFESPYLYSQTGYRSFYIDDKLYTSSPNEIMINALNDIKNEIGYINLDFVQVKTN